MITPLQLVRKSIGTLVGLGGVTCGLTMLYLSARVLMGIGGSCGSGGPYVLATPCPDGIGWIMPVSIVGGIIAMGIYAASLLPVGPRVVLLAWPALFISLGSVFLESSFTEAGVEWGFMVCAVLFVIMGGVPLLFLTNRDAQRSVFWGPAAPKVRLPAPIPLVGNVRWTNSVAPPGGNDLPRGSPRPVRRFSESNPRDSAVDAGSGDLVGRLERLSALHRKGRLDDAEYAAAKARLLNGST